MANSMTAFSRVEGDGFLWEIRSENHRGLDIRVKLPDELQPLEFELIKAVRASTSRGKVNVLFRSNRSTNTDPDQRQSNLLRLTQVMESLAQSLPSKVTPSVDLLALLKSSSTNADQVLNDTYDFPSLKTSFESALTAFHTERQREGEELQHIVMERVRCCRECSQELRRLKDNQVATVQSGIEQRLEALNATVDPIRLAQEVALMAQKADFSEELDRLDVHLDEIESRLADDEPTGRRLVFLAQELAREANTLASKSQSGDCSLLAVDLKVYVDQIREQVQNIE